MSDVVVSTEIIEERIFLVRGQKVVLDSHLAKLYDVPTKSLNLAVKRNRERFPDDFMFRLTREEYRQFLLRFQIETSKAGKGGRRYLPYVFTEQGVAMLSSVVGSKRAIQVNIAIMRAFVKLREILSTHKELAQKLAELERRIENHDSQIHAIFEAIRHLMRPEEKPKRQIGFRVDEPHVKYSVNKLKKKLLTNRLLKKLFSCLCEERSDEAISLFKQKMRLLRDETARRDTLLCVFQQPAKTF